MKKKRIIKFETGGSSSKGFLSEVRTHLHSAKSKVGMKLRFHSKEQQKLYLQRLNRMRQEVKRGKLGEAA